MKKFFAMLLILVPMSFANAQYPEVTGMDAEEVFSIADTQSFQLLQTNDRVDLLCP